ncbi:hypothetical protein CQW23_19507 [Capsicum baccatum]|uniref:Uncharacterized protein n=1 Tax=Capsicum baccatum TaxID=33114 RepID=A0A2G2W5Z7_CAPBA|nr:hypothetical protein CQW23_19507 [Capsicum baccatum]
MRGPCLHFHGARRGRGGRHGPIPQLGRQRGFQGQELYVENYGEDLYEHIRPYGHLMGRDTSLNSTEVTLPPFKGENNPDVFLDWATQCDQIFLTNEMSEMKIDFEEDYLHAMTRFRARLSKEIASKMRLHTYRDIDKTLEAAIEIELGLKEKLNKSRGYKGSWNYNKKGGSSSSTWSKNKGNTQETKKPLVQTTQVEKTTPKSILHE